MVSAGLAIGVSAVQRPGESDIPGNIHYPFYPECDTHMSPVHPGYGKMTCRGGYKVNRGNYQFTISRFWSLNRGMVARGRGCS